MSRQKPRNAAGIVHPSNRKSRPAPHTAGIAGAAVGSEAPPAKPQRLGMFDRYLTVWVFLCIVAGIGLGHLFPGAFHAVGRLEAAKINLPVAALIWLMVIPMLIKVDLKALKGVVKHWRGVGVTLLVNWGVKPFSMALLGWIFIGELFRPWLPGDRIDSYIAGLILLAAAPCTAMVFVWSHLSRGEPHFTLSQVALNDLIMVAAFAPIVGLLLGLSAITVPWNTLLLSVLLYIVVPLAMANLLRAAVLRHADGPARLNRLLKVLHPVSLTALLATLVLLFGFQGEQILTQPLVILLLAVPILIQVLFNSGLAYLLNRLVRSPHCVAGPSALIGASNFFELAVATAIALFGFESGAALATVVGVLIEVPVMLLAVGAVNRSHAWYERRRGVPGYEECCPANAHLHAGH
jgi:ACR3 family arsenite transporter